MSKKKLILMPSTRMSNNKKKDRYEDTLIRFGKKARTYLGLDQQKEVEVWSVGSPQSRASRSKMLKIFQAFSEDLKSIKHLPEDHFNRVGFVTNRTFQYLCGELADSADIWVADSIEDIIIGADPEFALENSDGELMRACAIEGLSFSSDVGYDGRAVEIRPAPDSNVDTFVENIRNLLVNHKNVSLIKHYRWYAGAVDKNYTIPLGGHIHIGTPIFIAKKTNKKQLHNIFSLLNTILAKYVALPLMALEGAEQAAYRRTELNYGYLNDFRTDRDRLEHRVASGIWLIHPSVAKGVIGSAKAISEETYKFIEADNYKITKSKLLGYFNTSNVNLLGRQLEGDAKVEINKKFIDKWFETMSKLTTYKSFRNYIDLFAEILLRHEDLHLDNYFRDSWLYKEKFDFE